MEKDSKEKIVVTGLNLKLGDKRITLTVEQAKKLKQALDDIFGKKEVIKEVHNPWYPHYPYRWYWEYPTDTHTFTFDDNTSCQVNYDSGNNQAALIME